MGASFSSQKINASISQFNKSVTKTVENILDSTTSSTTAMNTLNLNASGSTFNCCEVVSKQSIQLDSKVEGTFAISDMANFKTQLKSAADASISSFMKQTFGAASTSGSFSSIKEDLSVDVSNIIENDKTTNIINEMIASINAGNTGNYDFSNTTFNNCCADGLCKGMKEQCIDLDQSIIANIEVTKLSNYIFNELMDTSSANEVSVAISNKTTTKMEGLGDIVKSMFNSAMMVYAMIILVIGFIIWSLKDSLGSAITVTSNAAAKKLNNIPSNASAKKLNNIPSNAVVTN